MGGFKFNQINGPLPQIRRNLPQNRTAWPSLILPLTNSRRKSSSRITWSRASRVAAAIQLAAQKFRDQIEKSALSALSGRSGQCRPAACPDGRVSLTDE